MKKRIKYLLPNDKQMARQTTSIPVNRPNNAVLNSFFSYKSRGWPARVTRAEAGQGDKSNSRSDSSESISQTYLHKMLSSSCCISLPETKYLKIAVFAVQLSPYRQFPPWVVTYKLRGKTKVHLHYNKPKSYILIAGIYVLKLITSHSFT